MGELLKTKSFWLGLGTIGFGVYLLMTGNTDGGIAAISGGLGLMSLRDAIAKIQ